MSEDNFDRKNKIGELEQKDKEIALDIEKRVKNQV